MEKVVIQCNEYFTEDSWVESLKKHQVYSSYAFEFVTNRKEFISVSQSAVAGFTFNLDPKSFNQSAMQWVYLGISDMNAGDIQLGQNKVVYTSKGMAATAISEFVLMCILNSLRSYDDIQYAMSKKRWDQETFLRKPKVHMSELTVGVLGYGNIGKAVAKMLQPFGSRVLLSNRTTVSDTCIDKSYGLEALNSFFKESDVVVCCLPLRNETRGLVRYDHLAALGSEGVFINVSRGGIVLEEDLLKALSGGVIRKAYLDVFDVEPLPRKSKLWKMKNAVVSPHISGNVNFLTKQVQDDFCKHLQ